MKNSGPKEKKLVTWKKRIWGIGPEWEEMPASQLIYPLSPFGLSWLAITALFLVYTAVVTPPMIAFHWLDEACSKLPTLPIDVILDIFFLVDILINFNMGVITAGEYTDDRMQVTKDYLKGGFMFDICTSIPVSFVELHSEIQCASATQLESSNTDGLRLVRAIKPFKIARLMKLGKSAAVITVLMDYYEISPKQGKTLQVLFSLVGCVHIVACVFWFGKVLGANSDLDTVNGFLESLPWGSQQPADLRTASGKVEAYFVSSKPPPHDPRPPNA